MGTAITTFKPCKKNPRAWNTGKIREAKNGRQEIGVEIGSVQVKDVMTGETSTKPVIEYIYNDMFESMIDDMSGYDLKLLLGNTVQIMLMYDNRLIPYSEASEALMGKIKDYLKQNKRSAFLTRAVDALLAGQNMTSYSADLKKTTDDFNAKNSVSVPVEIMAAMIKEYVCDRTSKSDYEEDLKCLDYKELAEEIANTIKKKDVASYKLVQQEIFYRFLQGDLIAKNE